MAAATYIPAKLALSQANGTGLIDFDTDTLKCMWVVAGTGRPSTAKTGVQFVSDVTATNAEVTGTGYARQTLASLTVAFDGTATNQVNFGFANITFAQNAAGFANGVYLVFYKDVGGADTTRPVFAIYDPAQTVSVVNGDVIISAPAGGMLQWTVP